MEDRININTAGTKLLTQLPGIAKNLAYRIVSHRTRHGYFTHWEELAEVKEFPMHLLDKIKKRASLEMPPDVREPVGPRRIKPAHLREIAHKTKGYTRKIRSTSLSERLKPPA
jgi:Helix-hairpin-helix motif